uniref:Uncharacterized protein n=1 Tax=Arundo donax TaxID=35708 RepID=A0A0A8ZTP2_ARUDO
MYFSGRIYTYDFYISKLKFLKAIDNQSFKSLTESWSKRHIFKYGGSHKIIYLTISQYHTESMLNP